jgi:Bacterial antitoxin of type II TA system, VapB
MPPIVLPMCIVALIYTHSGGALAMRTNIEIDDALMAEAQKASDSKPRSRPWSKHSA